MPEASPKSKSRPARARPGAAALTITPRTARRFAVLSQRLAGSRPAPDASGIMEIARHLRCIQVDPISVVARTQHIVLFSRLGAYERAELDSVLWEERSLFHYWAHSASMVLTEDYPIHRVMMRTWPGGHGDWTERTRAWLEDNAPLRNGILQSLKRNGPMRRREFDDFSTTHWESSGWTAGQNVSRMLDFLWTQGRIMIAGREGLERVWDLTARFLPGWTPRKSISAQAAARKATAYSLRALGIGTPKHIREHFTRGRYPGLPQILATMERRGEIMPVEISGGAERWPGRWYVRTDELAALENVAERWEPRTVLLSPFDNLICDRARTAMMFDFDFRIEIYVPPAKRKYGYYVLPILHGDAIIGRLDPKMDRARNALVINAIYREEGAPTDAGTGRAVRSAIEDLAGFLGARTIDYPKMVPRGWSRALR